MSSFDQVVVALRAPGGDTALVQYAAVLARLGRTTAVRFVHVAAPEADAAALRAQMRTHVRAAFDGCAVRLECDVLHGTLSDRLLAYVTEFQADLLLIGSKRRQLAARLAMVAPCSVGVLPDDRPATLSHMLVAFDFSIAAVETLQWATGLLSADPSIRCTALHVVTHESTDLFAGQESEEAQAEKMRQILAAADKHGVPVAARLAGVERSTDVGRSHPFSFPASIEGSDIAHTIIAEAARCGADWIAVSTRGRSRAASILLGSVSEKVIERAQVPLLIGKHGGATLGLASILLGQTSVRGSVKTN